MKPRIYFQSEIKRPMRNYSKIRNNKLYLSSIDGKVIVNGERR